jgi:hypothetical protein
MKRRWLALGALGLALLGSVPVMADDMVQNLDPSLHLFCRDDKRVFQPLYQGVSQLGTFKQTSLGALYEGMTRHFGWTGSLHSTSDTIGYLVFSQTGTRAAKETIIWAVEPHADGVALLHMHVRTDGAKDDLSGTKMCGVTWTIVNERN